MLPACTIIDSIGGVARGVDLAAFGHTRRDLVAAVRAGEIERLRPGVFATVAAPPLVRTAARHGAP